MIVIPRSLCRDLRSVFCATARKRTANPPVVMMGDKSGLSVQAVTDEVAVACRLPGRWPASRVTIPLTALADCGGAGDAPVTIRPSGNEVQVEWSVRGAVVRRSYPAPSDSVRMPPRPTRFVPASGDVLAALDAASRVAAQAETDGRYVLSRIQLRRTGEIVATDARQLLMQGGIAIPGTGEGLMPSSGVFSVLAALAPGAVSLARTPRHLWIAAGPWTVALSLQREARYPDVDGLIARIPKYTCELVFSDEDAARLMQELPRMPGRSEPDQPVTLDLAKNLVRAGVHGDAGAECRLRSSRRTGRGIVVECNRLYLLTALQMRFRRLAVCGGNDPVVFRDGTRTYLFLPLSEGAATEPARPKTRSRHSFSAAPEVGTAAAEKPRPTPRAVSPRGSPRQQPRSVPASPERGRWSRLWHSVRNLVRSRR
jgi:hypothetical protein